MPTRTAARSPDELAFLRAIAEDLSRPLPQLVYCDWLEERGDPLGPFLREFLGACLDARPLPPDPPELPRVWAQVLGLPLRRVLRKPLKPTKAKPATVDQFLAHEPAILRATRPCVGMRMGKAQPLDRMPTGISRADGLPDLPAREPWPTYPDRGREWPMQFLFQVNLVDLRGTFAEGFLPEAGLVSVFHSPVHDERRPRVLFAEPDIPLRRACVPEPGHLEPTQFGTDHMPTATTHPLSLTDICVVSGPLPWPPPDDLEVSSRLQDDYFAFTGRLPEKRNGPKHFLCQTWYPECCSTWATLHDELPPGLFRLAKLDSSHNGSTESPPGWGFGDGDRLHVFAPLEDAKVGKFDNVVTTEFAP